MPSKLNKNRTKQNRNDIDRLLAIPGVKEAIKAVRRYAFKGAREDAAKFAIDDSMVDYDLSDELLESLGREAGPKIAELWNLSERAGGGNLRK